MGSRVLTAGLLHLAASVYKCDLVCCIEYHAVGNIYFSSLDRKTQLNFSDGFINISLGSSVKLNIYLL